MRVYTAHGNGTGCMTVDIRDTCCRAFRVLTVSRAFLAMGVSRAFV